MDFASASDLQAWGARFAKLLTVGNVVALVGPLGAGKTTLVQGIVRGCGYKQGASSPTFALANEYRTPRGNVYHMDMYRLSTQELAAFPLEDYFGDGICLIEWADRVRSRWPAETLELELSIPRPDLRQLQLRASAAWQARLKSFGPASTGKRR